MQAELLAWKTNSIANGLQGVELKRIDTNALANHLDHLGVLRRSLVLVGLEVADLSAFEFFDAATSYELHIGFR